MTRPLRTSTFKRSKARGRRIHSFVSFIVGIAAWETICRLGLFPPLYLPAPSTIALEFVVMIQSGELLSDIFASGYRILIGFLLGCLVGIPLGFLLGLSTLLNAILDPFVSAIYPLPKIALLPLIILWLGIGEESKVFVVALAVFFPIAINSMAGVRLTEPILVKAASNLGADRLQVISKVILPSAVPSILTGVRLGGGTALLTLVAAEMIAAESGLGHLVLYSGDLMLTTKLMVGLVVIAVLGISVSKFTDYLEEHFLKWRAQPAGKYL